MRRNNYPSWLKVHLKKGVYANKTSKGYTLYKAHSIYDPKTKRSVRISDGVLGTVTESGGFVPKKAYRKKDLELTVYTYGIYKAILHFSKIDRAQLSRPLIYFKNEIIVGSILLFLFGKIDIHDYRHSYLSLKYPKVRFNYLNPNNQIHFEIERYRRKLVSTLDMTVIHMFSYVYLVKMNDTYQVVGISDKIKETGVDLTYEEK